MSKIERALLSVSDKTGLAPLARLLLDKGVELISTGGTAQFLKREGLAVRQLEDFSGFPEILDGRVKTLHPKVHGGLLFQRENAGHLEACKLHQIEAIDLLVVNLYPFEKVVEKSSASIEELIENIDIGGPSMLRSSAKNYLSVTVVTDPEDYPEVMGQIKDQGETTLELRQRLALRAFERTAKYDRIIAYHLRNRLFPPETAGQPGQKIESSEQEGVPSPAELVGGVLEQKSLRYGENPHQRGAIFGRFEDYFHQVQGKQLSYNNILDLTAAADLIREFAGEQPTLAILKHMNPCGVGQGATCTDAWRKALATDREAPFGGIISANTELDGESARSVAEIFSEVIVAPSFSEEAREVLSAKKNLRLVELRQTCWIGKGWAVRSVGSDLFLVQERDSHKLRREEAKIVTDRAPTSEEWEALLFGWRIIKHVKSNAIVFASRDRTLAIGAGQVSRVDAARLAIIKAQNAGLSLTNSAVCSDAFFPFADGLKLAADVGSTAAIQPGGSIRDGEVIESANARKMAMVFTGVRHFWH